MEKSLFEFSISNSVVWHKYQSGGLDFRLGSATKCENVGREYGFHISQITQMIRKAFSLFCLIQLTKDYILLTIFNKLGLFWRIGLWGDGKEIGSSREIANIFKNLYTQEVTSD